MPNDSLHMSDNLAGPPNDADYAAAYAEIMATERGRRFLIEYAIRNRHPDTHILVSTIARLEAAMHDDPSLQVPAAFKRDLTELASAIARIEAKLVASGTRAPDSLPTAERIKDIIVALRDLARRVDVMSARAAAAHGGAIPAPVTAEPGHDGPDEDPGDLFEPQELAAPRPLFTPVKALEASIAPAVAIDSAVKSKDTTPHVPTGPPPQAIPRAAPSDSLAAMRALSEEELIALFS